MLQQQILLVLHLHLALGLVHIPLFPEHAIRQRNRRLVGETSATEEEGHATQVDALYQGYGTHYVDLWCGTPPQRQTVILNTGGPGTAFPCSDCHDCGIDYHVDNYFQEENSISFRQVSCDECFLGTKSSDDPSKQCFCQFGVSYVEGSSWRAKESLDHCYIGGLHNKPISIDDGGHDDLDPEHAVAFAFDLLFGCQTSITGLFVEQLADGILGMDNSDKSFWHQMYEAHMMEEEKFSLCYSRQPHVNRSGTESGAMTLGGTDDRFHLTPMVFTFHDEDWERSYGVLLRKVYIREGGGGDSINSTDPSLKIIQVDVSEEALNQGPVIIESGTTDTYLTNKLAEPFQQVWKSMTGSAYNNRAVYLTYEQIQKLPTIILQLQGAIELNKEVGDPNKVVSLAGNLDPEHPYDVLLALPPTHYMELSEATGAYYARFNMEEPPQSGSLLGANAIMGHDVLFDTKNHRVGWAESHCDYTHLVEKEGFAPSGNVSPNSSPVAAPVNPLSPVPAPTKEKKQYPAQTGGETSNTICGSFCKLFWIFVAGFVASVFVIRQGKFGILTERVRRLTGGSEYQHMFPNEYNTGHELELHEASRYN
ncbi:hypothetical protein FisN_2Lh320 [Fistulifera solaris]|uniref:Peptidase A1 domain-containing protein n=1 Tax=Fistulifera solaris TaxID=1519565 RepID=A0A1Z5KFY0_FISSO|nr:hypothetical protein FisN_2Lh320 [Fistulifera solaris]|eukprot:GAX25035.1 hypothetical protein FisN_2Lh320 [Fistulifera solaris]